ncbi:MAG: hypothetical protein DI565_17970 [Ancylobacter novellus]|uniref:Tripartite tricarboxylate transporter substrate binding protein n=1 Tax=Ancylobacter novellus TaxID=921 RepID=A0A2W5K953_ANCNO|nr:MAG: hypothetical protein DI565_17970 [Ancylobacter novellus]
MRPVDRRSAIFGGMAVAAVAASPGRAQTVGLEILSAGKPGDGDDQLARAVAEGFGVTELLPRAVAVNVERDAEALSEFLDGKRPRAALMVIGLSSVGMLLATRAPNKLSECRPVARLIGERQPIVVQAASPYRTIDDLMTAIRRDTASVTWTGRPIGGADHQLALLLTKAAGGDMARLSYRPADSAAQASYWALKGETQVATGPLIEYAAQILGGTLRALALASPDRAPGLDTPTLKEQGVDLAMINWRGVASRASVGQALIDRFGQATMTVSGYKGWGQLLQQRFWSNLYEDGASFERFIAEETTRVSALLSEARVI